MALATLTFSAQCSTVNACQTQSGTADAELDLAIHGPAGTPGLLEFDRLAIGNPLATASATVTGLTVFLPFPSGPHGGTVYNFIYEQPFRISAMVQGGCSECGDSQFPFHASARVIAPFYVYDTNLNLLATITSPLDIQAAPEPGTIALFAAGLLFLAYRTLLDRLHLHRTDPKHRSTAIPVRD